MRVHYFNLDHNNAVVQSKLKEFTLKKYNTKLDFFKTKFLFGISSRTVVSNSVILNLSSESRDGQHYLRSTQYVKIMKSKYWGSYGGKKEVSYLYLIQYFTSKCGKVLTLSILVYLRLQNISKPQIARDTSLLSDKMCWKFRKFGNNVDILCKKS